MAFSVYHLVNAGRFFNFGAFQNSDIHIRVTQFQIIFFGNRIRWSMNYSLAHMNKIIN
jgi:hypothetical protein